MRLLPVLYQRTMLGKPVSERTKYQTQIYRRSDGFSHRTCLKNQYIFVFMIGANNVSKYLLS
jgi:hypothetical protein